MSALTLEQWRERFEACPTELHFCPTMPIDLASATMLWQEWVTPFRTPCHGDAVLDLGCGSCRLAVPVLRDTYRLYYRGVDCRKASQGWASQLFRDVPRAAVDYTPARNGLYNPEGSADATLPYGDETFDYVVAMSFFTHQGDYLTAVRYLQECHRVLRPGGVFLSTWFVSPPNKLHTGDDRSVYDADTMLEMIRERGFRVLEQWGGETAEEHDQRKVVVVKVGQ